MYQRIVKSRCGRYNLWSLWNKAPSSQHDQIYCRMALDEVNICKTHIHLTSLLLLSPFKLFLLTCSFTPTSPQPSPTSQLSPPQPYPSYNFSLSFPSSEVSLFVPPEPLCAIMESQTIMKTHTHTHTTRTHSHNKRYHSLVSFLNKGLRVSSKGHLRESTVSKLPFHEGKPQLLHPYDCIHVVQLIELAHL